MTTLILSLIYSCFFFFTIHAFSKIHVPFLYPWDQAISGVYVILACFLIWLNSKLNISEKLKSFLTLIVFLSVVFSLTWYYFSNTEYGPSTVYGDSGFQTAYITKFKYFWSLVDFSSAGLHSYYPFLYHYIVGKLALLFNQESFLFVKYGFLATLFVAPIAYFLTSPKNLSLNATLISCILFLSFHMEEMIYKPAEMLSLLLFINFYLLYYTDEPKEESKTLRIVYAGLLGTVVFCNYYYWFFPLIILFIWKVILSKGKYLTSDFAKVLYTTALLTSFYWLPLGFDLLSHGIHSFQNRFLAESMLAIYPSEGTDIWKQYLSITGVIAIIFYYSKDQLIYSLGELLASAFFWIGFGFLGILINAPVLHLKTWLLIDLISCVAIGFVIDKSLKQRFKDSNSTVTISALFLLLSPHLISTVRETAKQAQNKPIEYRWQSDSNLIDKIKGKIFLTDLQELRAFLPIFSFVEHNAHYAHPASDFEGRIKFLQDAATISDAKSLACALTKNDFSSINYIALTNGKSLTVFKDNFPHAEALLPVTINFNDRLFVEPYFKREELGPKNGVLYVYKVECF